MRRSANAAAVRAELGWIPALSLRQPWAWTVCPGPKRVENRVWDTTYRGRFFIHASAQSTEREYREVQAFCDELYRSQERLVLPPPKELTYGAIIGVAELVDVLPPLEYPDRPWHMVGQFGYVLRDVRELEPLPCKGLQRWWNAAPLRVQHPTWAGWKAWAE